MARQNRAKEGQKQYFGVFLVGAALASGYASTLAELQVTFGCMVGAGMGFGLCLYWSMYHEVVAREQKGVG
ncbi:hypothetical protein OH492_18370 [Vibrio chagasii]|nr:hypothetical protein [Vibrio chagasii]